MYHDFMISGGNAAAVFNAQRTKRTDRVWTWKDFHPAHQTDDTTQPLTGKDVVHGIRAWYGEQWQWLPGYGPTEL